MSKYHVNSKGEPGICQAKKYCPYGDLEKDHYPTKEAARLGYENTHNPIKNTIKTSKDLPKRIKFFENKEFGDGHHRTSYLYVSAETGVTYSLTASLEGSGYLSFYKEGIQLNPPIFKKSLSEAHNEILSFEANPKNFKNGEFEIAKKTNEYDSNYVIVDCETGNKYSTDMAALNSRLDKDSFEMSNSRPTRILSNNPQIKRNLKETTFVDMKTKALVKSNSLKIVNISKMSSEERKFFESDPEFVKDFSDMNGASVGI